MPIFANQAMGVPAFPNNSVECPPVLCDHGLASPPSSHSAIGFTHRQDTPVPKGTGPRWHPSFRHFRELYLRLRLGCLLAKEHHKVYSPAWRPLIPSFPNSAAQLAISETPASISRKPQPRASQVVHTPSKKLSLSQRRGYL